jgi:hypothetical protein
MMIIFGQFGSDRGFTIFENGQFVHIPGVGFADPGEMPGQKDSVSRALVGQIGGVEAVSISNLILLRLGLNEDLEYVDGHWVGGDGKLAGLSAVLAVVALREGELTSKSPATAALYGELAGRLEKELAPQIDTFVETINAARNSAPKAA